GIVTGRVRAHAVGDALHEGRPQAGPSALHRFVDHGVARQDVVAVDPHARDAVGVRLDGDGRAGRLALGGHADGPLVVLADHHAGHLEHTREIDGVVKVWLAGRAVSHEPHGNDAVALDLRRPGRAHRLGDLGTD